MGRGFGLTLLSNGVEKMEDTIIIMPAIQIENCPECKVQVADAALLWHTERLEIMDFCCQDCAVSSGHPWMPVLAE